jgi:hypothetical protein
LVLALFVTCTCFTACAFIVCIITVWS